MFNDSLSRIHHSMVINGPKVLAIPCVFIPFNMQAKLLVRLLGKMFKEAIEDGDLDFLEGKWLKVTVNDLKLTWYISFKDESFIISETRDKEDVSFLGNSNEFILIAGRREDPDTLFFQRRLSIQGDTELGLEIKNLLDNIEMDKLSDFTQKGIKYMSGFVQDGLQA